MYSFDFLDWILNSFGLTFSFCMCESSTTAQFTILFPRPSRITQCRTRYKTYTPSMIRHTPTFLNRMLLFRFGMEVAWSAATFTVQRLQTQFLSWLLTDLMAKTSITRSKYGDSRPFSACLQWHTNDPIELLICYIASSQNSPRSTLRTSLIIPRGRLRILASGLAKVML
jgi:hypothetical protein